MLTRFLPLALLALIFNAQASNSQESSTIEQLPLDDLRTFTKVYTHIRNAYVEEISDRELLEYAIKGMLAELDPHSNYLDATSFDDLQVNTTGEFGGLGIEVGMENGFVKVIAPIDDTPASKAGLQAGDLIINIDDTSVKGLSMSEAIELMRGPIDTEVVVKVMRRGLDKAFDVTLVRDIIKVRSVRSRVLEPGFGYVRIAQFQLGTGGDFKKEVSKLLAQNPDLKGMVLDLRNNPGGVLQASVEVVDAVLDEGLVVYTEGRVDDTYAEFQAVPGDLLAGMPVVVLINEGSASASEIVAGALQDHGRAVIMGTESFGKGSVQTVIPISDERAIKLTTALYFTPNGRSIQAQGISPDITVQRAQITALGRDRSVTEADLAGHLDNANGGEDNDAKSRAARSQSSADIASRDNQLFEALNLLKGITIYARNEKQVQTAQTE